MSGPTEPDIIAGKVTANNVEVDSISDTPGFNYGGSGMSESTGWFLDEGVGVYRDINTQGMTNVVAAAIEKYGVGDLNGFNLNAYTRGGTQAPADEGFSGFRNYLTLGTKPYKATIATGGGGKGATTLLMSWAETRNAGVGQVLLDLSTAVSFNATELASVGGDRSTSGQFATMKTDATFTPSKQLTLTALNSCVAEPNNAGSVQSLTFKVGSEPLVAGDLIQIGGVFPECVRVIAAQPAAVDGTQVVTGTVRSQHWPGTIAFAGGPAGHWIEQTNYTKNGLRFVSYVLGALDATTLAVFNLVPGGMDPGFIMNGPITMYAGGVITDTRQPQNSPDGIGLNIKLEDNDGTWADGSSVEGPNAFTAWWKGYASLVQNNNPFSRGQHFAIMGNGSAFGGTDGGDIFFLQNTEPLASYIEAGGHLQHSSTFRMAGEFGTLFDLDRTPHGALFLLQSDSFTLAALKNHTASIGFDATSGSCEWILSADRILLPHAVFSNTGEPSPNIAFTAPLTVQGTDGAGTPSLTVLKPVSIYGKEALRVKGDVVIDGALTIAGLPAGVGPTGAVGLQGPKGDTGAVGPQGVPGAKGDTGAIGLPGYIGLQGPQGVPGPKGDQGVQGAAGPAGPPGSSASVLTAGITGTFKTGGVLGMGKTTIVVKNGLIQSIS